MPDIDPLAWVCYDFILPGPRRIKGKVEVRRASDATRIAAKLNAEFGEGSHWVETANETYEERLESFRLTSPEPPG